MSNIGLRGPVLQRTLAALVAGTCLGGGAAQAQDATWLLNPGSGDFNTASNWSTGSVPFGTATFGVSNTTNLTVSTNTPVGGWTFNAGASDYSFTNTAAGIGQTLDFTGAGIVIHGGSVTIANNGDLRFFGSSTAGSANITSGIILEFNDTSNAGNATITNEAGGLLLFRNSSTADSATITNNGTLVFAHASTAGSATIINNLGSDQLRFEGNSTAGSAQLINNAGGIIDFSDSTGPAGDGEISAGSIAGAGAYYLGSNTLTIGGNGLDTTVSGVISDCGASGNDCRNAGATGGALVKTGSGTLTLSGANTYTGTTTVEGGALLVNGSIGSSSLTTVNAGGTLGGTGTVGATMINNGGIFAPGSGVAGTAMTVNGPLTFNAGSIYQVNVAPVAASNATVNGSATLTGGTVNAQFAPGSYMTRNYTILTASGGLGGTTFNALTATNLPAHFVASLSYAGNDVILNLVATLGELPADNLNRNQRSVANALNTFFNSGGALPPGFVTVFGLTGPALGTVLTQLSGEHATGIQQASNLSTGMFLNAMLDPFVTGRSGGFGAAMGYAPEAPSRVAVAAREAYAADMPAKAAPPAAIYEQRWSVWGAAYGGRNRTDGEPVIGSNDLTAKAYGFAAGADYRVSPSSVIGAAFAIGETRWNVAGVGKGNADVAQVGGYASTRWNDLYVSGAVALAWHDASTDRTLNIAGTDQLRADFNATSWGARFEGGYRYGGPMFGVTPYAAVQMQSVRTPDYSERATAGSNQFALSYVSESVIDTRTELGFWADARHALGNGSQLILRGRAAWVHDFNPDSRIQAAFQTLPGTSFVVDGAAAPRDAALTSAVAELRMANGVSLIGKFDGEFSGRSTTYAGTGTLRYAW
jgi:outer membrane autotransporter protein